MTFLLPDVTPIDGIYVVDTADMFAAFERDSNGHRSLESTCNHLKLKTKFVHNAGNDAYVSLCSIIQKVVTNVIYQYTLSALKAMASGNDLDTQREERWPNRINTESKTKVLSNAWDEECSDFEA